MADCLRRAVEALLPTGVVALLLPMLPLSLLLALERWVTSNFVFSWFGGYVFVLPIWSLFSWPFARHISWRCSCGANSVPQKYILQPNNYWGTLIAIRRTDMANILSMDKQFAVVSALADFPVRSAVRAAIVQEFRNRESKAEA